MTIDMKTVTGIQGAVATKAVRATIGIGLARIMDKALTATVTVITIAEATTETKVRLTEAVNKEDLAVVSDSENHSALVMTVSGRPIHRGAIKTTEAAAATDQINGRAATAEVTMVVITETATVLDPMAVHIHPAWVETTTVDQVAMVAAMEIALTKVVRPTANALMGLAQPAAGMATAVIQAGNPALVDGRMNVAGGIAQLMRYPHGSAMKKQKDVVAWTACTKAEDHVIISAPTTVSKRISMTASVMTGSSMHRIST